MTKIRLRRHELNLVPESNRVIIRSFIPAETQRITTIIGRALALTEDEVEEKLAEVTAMGALLQTAPLRFQTPMIWLTAPSAARLLVPPSWTRWIAT